MKEYAKSINDHYSQVDLEKNILLAYKRAGMDIQALTRDDISSLDEFHIRGREATRELAQLAGLRQGMQVLDLGCGIGGPARTLAAEFGCEVTGLDLVDEYCRAARMLTAQVGLSHKVTFRNGDATNMPFDDGSFDVIWLQHMLMNIEDKSRLFEEAGRVIGSQGLIALYEICSGSISPPYFPVPWASDSTINFLVTPEELRNTLGRIGFKELVYRDVSAMSLEWFRRLTAAMASRSKDASRSPGLKLLMGSTAAEKSKNLERNLEEDRIRVIQGVFEIVEKRNGITS
jgi:ubiquinone/menaquinone biosynthesis C-methylase UbiE